MTTTSTSTPITQAVAEWTKIFPKHVTENYTSSVTFIKQLTVVALSTITYLKNIFPEDSYMIESFGGQKLRILKKHCSNDVAQFVSKSLREAFDAFDKKYLHKLALCFYEDECKVDNLIEYYIFEYTYHSEGVTLEIHTKNRDEAQSVRKCTFENVREKTLQLIRACLVTMQTCNNELPSTYDVSIRLYYNDDAPDDYQAPGFLPTQESEDHLGSSSSEVIKLGSVETPYHKVVSKFYMKDDVRASHEAIPSQHTPLMSQMDTDDFKDPETGATGEVRCPCNKTDEDDKTPMLTCSYCGHRQHAACFGWLARPARPAAGEHCCSRCAARVPRDAARGTRDTLHTLTARNQESLCIFRRTLALCLEASSIARRDLIDKFSISEASAAKLMTLLHSHGILLQDGTDTNTSKNIVPDKLKLLMSEFFQNLEEETIGNRLFAETLASQDSQSDPVSEVLSPMEKVSLQNATNLGRIIEKNNLEFNSNSNEDSTLKQYREVLISNDAPGDELPLSGSHNPVKDLKNIGRRTTKRKMSNDKEKPAPRVASKTKRAKARSNK